MRDKERGVVWEECIILLPRAARCIFLSATIPNASQFAHWVAAVHRQPCHVIGTSHRPTPLQHWVFPAGGSGLHLVLDEAGHFHTTAFERAMAELDTAEAAKVGGLGIGVGLGLTLTLPLTLPLTLTLTLAGGLALLARHAAAAAHAHGEGQGEG